jgi:hypothetical protein
MMGRSGWSSRAVKLAMLAHAPGVARARAWAVTTPRVARAARLPLEAWMMRSGEVAGSS